MAHQPRPLVAGNWKMHGIAASVAELEAIIAGAASRPPSADLMICPPATLIASFAKVAAGSTVAIGAQDCHAEVSGAFTGDLSAEMLKDAGATAVIVGHSERRSLHGETDDMVQAKAMAAARAGLTAILCIGETSEEREAGATMARLKRQLDGSLPDTLERLVIAYEPVWAIGTGRTPTVAQVEEVHQAIGRALDARFGAAGLQIRVLYGGSVKPDNAAELMAVPGVDGALVGGASLKAADFLAIAQACA